MQFCVGDVGEGLRRFDDVVDAGELPRNFGDVVLVEDVDRSTVDYDLNC